MRYLAVKRRRSSSQAERICSFCFWGRHRSKFTTVRPRLGRASLVAGRASLGNLLGGTTHTVRPCQTRWSWNSPRWNGLRYSPSLEQLWWVSILVVSVDLKLLSEREKESPNLTENEPFPNYPSQPQSHRHFFFPSRGNLINFEKIPSLKSIFIYLFVVNF